VFGSVARSEDSPGSDVDSLVTLDEDASLFDHIILREALEGYLWRHVDHVDREPHVGEIRSPHL
jgi:predicted nucleotidyltransferase